MCGIAGIISASSGERHLMSVNLQRMTSAIAHRGPDGEDFWMNQTVQAGLGHRRLKIIDLSDMAVQPMHYADRYSMVYNGEIYNYRELREELLSHNYVFKSKSDTEVILASYDFWKKDCLAHFDGMFSFAIWDEFTQELFCARDRFGEKPFYYSFSNGKFLFASEMKALWAAGIPRKILDTPMLNYITLGLVKNPDKPDSTFFEGIFTIPPAHFLRLRLPDFSIEVQHYWDIDKETCIVPANENAATEHFLFLLKRSVQRRLRTDVAIGASLSGGIDSSSVVACISDLQLPSICENQLKTFSALFPGFEHDETIRIQKINDQFRTERFYVQPDVGTLADDLDRVIDFQEEPFQSLSIYAQYKVYELARQSGVTVLLEGQGADEMLAGYHKYYHWYWQELFRTNKSTFLSERKSFSESGLHIDWGIKNKMAAWMPDLTARQLERKAIHAQQNHQAIEKDFFRSALDRHSISKPAIRKLNDILYYNTCQQGLEELLRYADRNSMAHGREARMPFLNHELVQFVFSLPPGFKIRHAWTKWILRQSMRDKLPQEIVWQKEKIGFEPPQYTWMTDKKMLDKIMDSRSLLVKNRILRPAVMKYPLSVGGAHAAENDDFRYLCLAGLLK